MGRRIEYGPEGVISDTDDRTLEQARAELLADIRDTAGSRILSVWPLWRQLNTLREGGDKLVQMGQEIDAIRAACNQALAAAEAATCLADLYAVSW